MPTEHVVEFRSNFEDTLNPQLLQAGIGGCIGGGSGLRYSYIDLALTDLGGAVPIIRQILAARRAPLRTWLLFLDDDLSREWVGLYAQTPEPPFPPADQSAPVTSWRISRGAPPAEGTRASVPMEPHGTRSRSQTVFDPDAPTVTDVSLGSPHLPAGAPRPSKGSVTETRLVPGATASIR